MQDLPKNILDLFRTVSDLAEDLGQLVYVVGGLVRDYYLHVPFSQIKDIDIACSGSGIDLACAVADKLGVSCVEQFERFGTAHFTFSGLGIEFATMRKESYGRDSRKPLVAFGSMEEDQKRRDLTVNALSWSLNKIDYGVLNDPFGGIQDIQKKILRTPVNPRKTFDDDPLRMVRVIRFATQLGFSIEDKTFKSIGLMASRLSIVSKERISDELNKIQSQKKPSIGWILALESGLLSFVLPELKDLLGVKEKNCIRHKDNFWHTMEVLDNVAEKSDYLWFRWAALLHDIAKPVTQKFIKGIGWTFHGHEHVGTAMAKKIFSTLKLPLDARLSYVQLLIRLHLRPIALAEDGVTEQAIRRLIVEAGSYLKDLMILCRADITSKNSHRRVQYNRNFDHVELYIQRVEEKDQLRNWKNPISGEDIMDHFGFPPGPLVGKIKQKMKDAIMDGDVPNDREKALSYMKTLKL